MIFTFTLNTAIDKIMTLKARLRRGANNRVESIRLDVGGKAAHVSIVLSQLGIDNIAAGIIGSRNKYILLDLMRSVYGVKTEFIEQDATTRETIVLLDKTGEGSIMITEKGFLISDETYDKLKAYMESSFNIDDIVVISGTPPPGISPARYGELLEIAHRSGAKVFVDASDEYLETAVAAGVYMIKPNEDEFRDVCGIAETITNKKDYIPYLDAMQKKGAKNIVLSLGAAGSILSTEDGHLYRYHPPRVEQRNDTGTGDAFVGGIVSGVSRGMDLPFAVVLGTAISASKAARLQSSGFNRQEAEKLLGLVRKEQWR